uniref:F-box domain-containing protein n=1 Tax=Opuntia streptacantha TaxID=393608 RepID=A0A7C9D0U1_OPUST
MADFKNQADQETSPQDGEDYFDLLPDPILLLIFNKLLDAKSLCRCLLVSKRFASLVPQIDSVSIQVNHALKPSKNSRTGSKSNFFKGFVSKFVTKPIQFLHQIMGKKVSSSSSKDAGVEVVQWIGTALKNFNEIQTLKLELPCYGGEIGVNRSIPSLKWEAGFGKDLERCVILGATSIVQMKEKAKAGDGAHGSDQNGEDDPLFTDEELKLRIIWIISCLIASSARHNLLKKVVNSCPKLSNAVILDAGKQGKLSMNEGQIRELRDSMKNTSNNPSSESEPESRPQTPSSQASTSGAQMGYVGNLVMKLWYVKELELQSSGQVMKGATMVVIRPDGQVGKEERESGGCGDGLSGMMNRAFEGDEVFGEAAKELLRRKEKRVYRLEMNTF